MTRTLTAAMQTEIAAQRGTITHLFEIAHSGGTLRFATAPQNISALSQTWVAVGGHLGAGAAEETPDPSAQGIEIVLSGVDTSFISTLMSNNVRGREVRIWLAHLTDSFTIVADPLEIFRGRQLSDYRISEQPPEGDRPGSCTVKTRVQSYLAVLRNPVLVATNEVSHNDMLKRAGLSTGDTFMRNVLAIAGQTIKWGPQWVKRGYIYRGPSFT